MRPFTTRLALATGAGLLAVPAGAHAVVVDAARWDTASVTASCGTSSLKWTCTYTFAATNCTELAVATPTGATSMGCQYSMTGTVTIQPRVVGLRQSVGCTSVARSGGVTAYYDSGLGEEFDRDNHTPVTGFFEVNDSDGTQGKALVTFFATVSNQRWRWTLKAPFHAPCTPGARWSDLSTLPGEVTVTDAVGT